MLCVGCSNRSIGQESAPFMIHFQSKNCIIDWLIDNCPRPAIVRALEQGRVEFLGGFNPIPPPTLPGWILKVTSLYNKQWNVAILADDVGHRYEIRIIKFIPWECWMGELKEPLFCGDNPELYKELKNAKCN